MVEAILIPISFFLVIFAICYLYFSTRNRERLALIEKGVDANIFFRAKSEHDLPTWKIVVINFAVLLISIGLGMFIGSFMESILGVDEEIAYPGTIFIMAGLGLIVGFSIIKKLEGKG